MSGDKVIIAEKGTQMPYKSHVDSEHELIHVTLSGNIAVEDALQFTADARRLADDHGYSRILFDARELETRPTTMELFDIGANPEKRGLTRRYKRATVFSGDEEGVRFFESVSLNRGYNVACFTDIEAAVKWLSDGQGNPAEQGQDGVR